MTPAARGADDIGLEEDAVKGAALTAPGFLAGAAHVYPE